MRKFAIAIFHGLGDCVLATSLIKPIVKKFPSATIDWYTSIANAPIVKHNPHVKCHEISGNTYLTACRPVLDNLKKKFGKDLIIAGPYFNVPSKDNTLAGSHMERITSIVGKTAIPFQPLMFITPQERQESEKWLEDTVGNKLFVMVEALFGSSQSFWGRKHTNIVLAELKKRDLICLMSHRTDSNIDDYNKICETALLDMHYRHIPAIYNKASAFIGVSSGISCITHTHQCKQDIPHLEAVRGKHWCTAALPKNYKQIIFDDSKFENAVRNTLDKIT